MSKTKYNRFNTSGHDAVNNFDHEQRISRLEGAIAKLVKTNLAISSNLDTILKNSLDKSNDFPITFTQADFESDGISYNNPKLKFNLLLQVNDEWIYAGDGVGKGYIKTETGIQMRTDADAALPNFDANVGTYIFHAWRQY